MKTYLYFDTETTGVIKRGQTLPRDVQNFPKITQLAWALSNENGRILESRVAFIKPDGWTVPTDKFFVDHGMSTEICEKYGNRLDVELFLFFGAMDKSDIVVAHNIEFDAKVLMANIMTCKSKYRSEWQKKFKEKPKYDTMKPLINFVGAKHKNGNPGKYPTLQELYIKLFNSGFDGGHDAMVDVKALMECHQSLPKEIDTKKLLVNDSNWFG